MKQNSSSRRVNEQARETIASILLFDISDPRLRLVTITGCEVSFDRSVCNVFYTTEKKRYEDVARAFEKASGRIRFLFGKKLSWRVAPELRFLRDESVDEAERIASALARDAARMPVISDNESNNNAARKASALGTSADAHSMSNNNTGSNKEL